MSGFKCPHRKDYFGGSFRMRMVRIMSRLSFSSKCVMRRREGDLFWRNAAVQILDSDVLFWSETTAWVTDLVKAEICIIPIHTFPSWYTPCKCISKAHEHVFSLHLSNLVKNRYLVLFSKVFLQRSKFIPFCTSTVILLVSFLCRSMRTCKSTAACYHVHPVIKIKR